MDEVEVENGGAVKNMAACEELRWGRVCIVKHRLRLVQCVCGVGIARIAVPYISFIVS